jgi:hypothetical protein
MVVIWFWKELRLQIQTVYRQLFLKRYQDKRYTQKR